MGWPGLRERMRREAGQLSQMLPQLPRLVHKALTEEAQGTQVAAIERLRAELERTNRSLGFALAVIIGLFAGCAVLLALVLARIG
jgi:ubiquinone biosynthesis protein